jgi:hypothetical protein
MLPKITIPNIAQKTVTSLAEIGESFESYNQAALLWFNFGFQVIPVVYNTKKTAVKWDSWLENLSVNTITDYWFRNSNAELGVIAGDEIIVLDADSPESIASLIEIETAFGITPNLIVNTKKGVHHYFKRASGTFAKSDAHDTEQHPNRIDVKTGRALIILPPSTGKEIEICDAENATDLVEVGQDFIDAIFRVNGREEPRAFIPDVKTASTTSTNAKQLQTLIGRLDPDIGYEDWLHIGMAIYHETGGSDEGLNIYDAWSSKGTKYSGTKEIHAKWSSFKSGSSKPITVGTIYKMLADQNIYYCQDDFIECDYDIIESSLNENPFEKFSLKGKAAKVEEFAVNAKPILGNIALAGQLTVIYAEFNSGKTLITLHLLNQAISEGIINPLDVYYLNMDDSSSGLLEKVHLADEFGFHMLSEGYEGFTSGKFVEIIRELVKTNKANGTVVILDTLKKFVDLMSKNESTAFAEAMRQYALKGGSLIALAHTNKAKVNGKPQYGGTNDIMSDFDCGYVVEKVSKDNGVNTVEFIREKGRGSNVSNVSYSYSNDSSLSYCQILTSVQEVDPTQLAVLKQVEQQKTDADIIDSVRHFIGQGIVTKMTLAKEVAKDSQVTQKVAIGIIERYEGIKTHWMYSIGPKGAKIYSLT